MTNAGRRVRAAAGGCYVTRGRVILLVVTSGLAASEFLGLCVSGLTGRLSLVQGVGLTVVLAGVVFVLAGLRGARWFLGGALAALGAYGVLHLMSVPHEVNLHSVLLATQSVIRLAGGAVLLSSRDVAAFCSAARDAASTTRRRRPR